ncbi:hypothetical protein L0U95_12335 [Burkholderia cenocepacia]|uniref:hypothetical protein n=1 Tax=Burkholderia cenocepacia TaxID=95486 RepID=UPI001F2D44A6|nr:hypothetical protein [Burkholderia cenocepacia]UJH72585.1 hypothetical protein L0U95_12335 [Burkholderia cenocepacia]
MVESANVFRDLAAARVEREARLKETYRLWMTEAPQRILLQASQLTADQLQDFLLLLTLEGYRDLYEYVVEQHAGASVAAQARMGTFLRKGVDMQAQAGERNRQLVKRAAEQLIGSRARPYSSISQLAADVAGRTGLSKSTVRGHLAALGMRVNR